MKKLSIAALAAAAAIVPAAAHAQAYVQIETGLDSVHVLGESDEGVLYGIAAGYEFPLGGSVFAGVEAGIADSTTKECESLSYSPAPPFSAYTETACLKSGRDISAVVRLGTRLGEESAIYILGGYTNARLKATWDDGYSKYSAGDNGDGFRLGAGYQHTFGKNFFGKVEYRYSNYEGDFSRHNGVVAVGVNF